MTKKKKVSAKAKAAGMRKQIRLVKKELKGFNEKMEALHVQFTALIEG